MKKYIDTFFRKRYKHYTRDYSDKWLYVLFSAVVTAPNQKKPPREKILAFVDTQQMKISNRDRSR